MRRLWAGIIAFMCFSGIGYTEPGSLKAGALVPLKSTERTHDISLVEFLTVDVGREEPQRLFSLNLGGSYKDESLGVAALFDINGVLRSMNAVTKNYSIGVDALSFEFGLYVSRQFSTAEWDIQLCATILSVRF